MEISLGKHRANLPLWAGYIFCRNREILLDKPIMIGYILVMINKITESKRIELAGSKEAERMYGPALMGATMRNGHIAALPEVGDKLSIPATGATLAITAIVYGADRNTIRCTCESNGQIAVRPWGQLLEAIEAGKLVTV